MTRNMFGFPKRLYEETRRNFRVKEALPITWTIGGLGSGSGRVCDLSSTGALIEAHATRPIGDGTVMALNQGAEPLEGFLPPEGRVVWSKSIGFLKKKTLCGVEFTHLPADVNDRLKKRIQDRIGELELGDKVMSAITIFLIIVMLSLGGLVLSQRSSISQTIERSNTLVLSVAGQQAKLYSDLLAQHKVLQNVYAQLELEYVSTKALLVQTENLLAETKRQYAQAQSEISILRSALSQAKVETLGDNVKVLVAQRDSLRDDLKALETEINAMSAGDAESLRVQSDQYVSKMDALDLRMENLKYETLLAKISDHQKQIQLARSRVSELKQEAALAKRETQRKKDALALSQGNRGFVIRDGKPSDSRNFSKVDPSPEATGLPAKKININVSFF